MKKYLTILIIGMIIVIIGALMKINNSFVYSNYLLIIGMILELISVFGIVKEYKKAK
jgi:hypothetical protein